MAIHRRHAPAQNPSRPASGRGSPPYRKWGAATGDVKLHSLIPTGHVSKQAIEDAALRPFSVLSGSWTLTIIPDEHAPWWIMTIEGPQEFSHVAGRAGGAEPGVYPSGAVLGQTQRTLLLGDQEMTSRRAVE
jgi:hypothetical protein